MTARGREHAELGADVFAEALVRGRAGDHDAGGGRDDERRDLADQAVADRQDRVVRRTPWPSDMPRWIIADDQAADDVDQR